MPTTKTCYKVVLASPGDVPAEREAVSSIIDVINNLKKNANVGFDLYRWETDAHPEFHLLGAQGVIDDALRIEDADILIGIFYLRFGTSVNDAESGTEHEINNAIKSWEAKRTPDIKLYFKKADTNPYDLDIGQFNKVKAFRDSVLHKGLIKDFETKEEFETSIRNTLSSYIDKKVSQQTPASIQTLPPPQAKRHIYPKPSKIFTGRKTELSDFKAKYETSGIIAIEGLGGTGKTEFSAKCIEDFIDDKSRLVWFVCQKGTKIDALMDEAGFPDVLKGENKTELAKYSGFTDLIEEHKKIIFIDNFHDADASFVNFLRFAEKYLKDAKVILISREHNPSLKHKIVKLEGLKGDALEYAKKVIAGYFPNIKIDDQRLQEICDKVCGHPFAIEQVLNLANYGERPEDVIGKITTTDLEELSRKLLEVLFTHPSTTDEEKRFLLDFSVLRGSVTREVLNDVVGDNAKILNKLIDKLMITYANDMYETHPLIKEFCYALNADKKRVHLKAAEFYRKSRSEKFDPVLHAEMLYHFMEAESFVTAADILCDRGEDFILSGHTNVVLEIIKRLKGKLERPFFYVLLGDIATIRGEFDQTLHYYETAFSTEDEKVSAEAYIKYGETLFRKGLAKEALKYFEDAYEKCRKLNYQKCEARSLNDIGLVKNRFDAPDALKILEDALKIRQAIGDMSGVAISLGNIGNALIKKDDFAGALAKCRESLKIGHAIGDKLRIAASLNSIGCVFLKRVDLKRVDLKSALEKFDESLRINREIGNKSGIATSFNNIGLVFQERGDYKGALEKFDESLRIAREIGDKSGIAAALHNMGTVYYENSERVKGLGYVLKGLALTRQMGFKIDEQLDWIRSVKRKGFREFKVLAKEAFDSLDDELKPYIDIQELTNEETIRKEVTVGRNAQCPCKSGKKYKRCCGAQ